MQNTVKEEIKAEIEAEIQDLLSPLYLLEDIGGKYLQAFVNIVDVFNDIKEAYALLKTGFVLYIHRLIV